MYIYYIKYQSIQKWSNLSISIYFLDQHSINKIM